MSGSMNQTGTTEGIEELSGTGSPAETESGEEASGTLAFSHTPVSSPSTSSGKSSGGGEASDEEDEEASLEANEETGEASEYEAGWVETAEPESSAETEATVDASQASGQEFFAFLAPLIVPLAKAVLPQLAGAAAKAGTGLLKNLITKRTASLRKRLAGRRESDTESGEENAAALEAEAAAEALAQLEVVIGTDDRIRVKNTKITPWNRICHLRIVAADGSVFLGTGGLIGKRSVVTAGHCVFLHNHGGWARSIEVSPGRNLEERPYGKIIATSFHSVKGWTVGSKRDFDYGFIVLPRAPNPFPGSFGVVSGNTDAEVRNKKLNTAGYPGDKAQTLPGSMWRHSRKATGVTSTVITYDIDTAGGQSGSPVWITHGNSRKMVGIHTNGAPSGNSATRINASVRANLAAWRQAAG